MSVSQRLRDFLDSVSYDGLNWPGVNDPPRLEDGRAWYDDDRSAFDPDDDDEDEAWEMSEAERTGRTPATDATPADVAGPTIDAAKAEQLLDAGRRVGLLTLEEVTRGAVERLIADSGWRTAGYLFTEAEHARIAEALASVTSTADLLGRSRVRIRQERAEAVRGLAGKFSEEPTRLERFGEEIQPLAPEAAVNYFRRLVPRVSVGDPEAYAATQRGEAFTLARVTDATLLTRVRDLIARSLETGEVVGTPGHIEKILDNAGVTHRNPQYSDMVFRTNAMRALAAGTQEEMRDPEVAEMFPVWRYAAIVDERSRPDHAQKNGTYYPASVSFDTVRGTDIADIANCRCVQVPVSRMEAEELKKQGLLRMGNAPAAFKFAEVDKFAWQPFKTERMKQPGAVDEKGQKLYGKRAQQALAAQARADAAKKPEVAPEAAQPKAQWPAPGGKWQEGEAPTIRATPLRDIMDRATQRRGGIYGLLANAISTGYLTDGRIITKLTPAEVEQVRQRPDASLAGNPGIARKTLEYVGGGGTFHPHPARPVAYRTTEGGTRTVLLRSEDGKEAVVDASLLRTLRSRHPGASIHFAPKRQADSPVFFRVGGETVALVMPLALHHQHSEGAEADLFSEGTVARFAEERPALSTTSVHGLTVKIEYKKGDVRGGKSADGTTWSQEMLCDYGRLPLVEGGDGECLDVFLGPQHDADRVYVVDQRTPDGTRFDELKVLLGFPSRDAAARTYADHYPPAMQEKILGNLCEFAPRLFRAWLATQKAEAPLAPLGIWVPDVRQSEEYSCGIAALSAAIQAVGGELARVRLLGQPEIRQEGVSPEQLITAAFASGVQAQGLTLDPTTLLAIVRGGRPVVCPMQVDDPRREASGHYVVVHGADAERVYYHDPLHGRQSLPWADWERRWHDHSGDGRRFINFGIVIWK